MGAMTAQEVPARVEEAVRRGREVAREWAARPVRERARVAAAIARRVVEAETRVLDEIQGETGKNRRSAFEEWADVALGAAWLARHAPRLLRPTWRGGAIPLLTTAIQTPRPLGVVGLITPWNYPFTLPVGDALPALVAGNAVVIKPASATVGSATLGLELLVEAGIPEGLVSVVSGPAPEVAEALIGQVDAVAFTGSTATGRLVAEQAGRHLVPFFGELGGKNPMIVLPDADIPRAARGAVRSCFANSGQLCVSIERIYLHRDIAEPFTRAFLGEIAAMRVDSGPDWDVDMGSLISPAHCDRVMAQVEDAVARGARVLAGGRRRPDLGPAFMDPTVLTDVPDDAELAREETFGPVVSLRTVSSEREALALANDTRYGLTASVWSRRRGSRLARELAAGSVTVNESYAAAWGSHGAMIGGWGDSGLGGRHGPEGLLRFTRAQTVATQRVFEMGPGRLPPDRYQALMRTAVRALTSWR